MIGIDFQHLGLRSSVRVSTYFVVPLALSLLSLISQQACARAQSVVQIGNTVTYTSPLSSEYYTNTRTTVYTAPEATGIRVTISNPTLVAPGYPAHSYPGYPTYGYPAHSYPASNYPAHSYPASNYPGYHTNPRRAVIVTPASSGSIRNIKNSVLLNPTIINGSIRNSTLVNPTIVNYPGYPVYSQKRKIGIYRDPANTIHFPSVYPHPPANLTIIRTVTRE